MASNRMSEFKIFYEMHHSGKNVHSDQSTVWFDAIILISSNIAFKFVMCSFHIQPSLETMKVAIPHRSVNLQRL